MNPNKTLYSDGFNFQDYLDFDILEETLEKIISDFRNFFEETNSIALKVVVAKLNAVDLTNMFTKLIQKNPHEINGLKPKRQYFNARQIQYWHDRYNIFEYEQNEALGKYPKRDVYQNEDKRQNYVNFIELKKLLKRTS